MFLSLCYLILSYIYIFNYPLFSFIPHFCFLFDSFDNFPLRWLKMVKWLEYILRSKSSDIRKRFFNVNLNSWNNYSASKYILFESTSINNTSNNATLSIFVYISKRLYIFQMFLNFNQRSSNSVFTNKYIFCMNRQVTTILASKITLDTFFIY